MNVRNRFYIVMLSLLMFSCEGQLTEYKGENKVQFKTSSIESYSFTYDDESVVKKEIVLELETMGHIVNYPRKVKVVQLTKEWNYVYDKSDPTKIIDSTWSDIKHIAKLGVHFEGLNEQAELIIPANSNKLNHKLVLLRDKSLAQSDYKLKLEIVPSDDFKVGLKNRLQKTIIISGQLTRPKYWNDKSYKVQTTIGNWSQVKHRFMIKVTQEKWDADFLYKMLNDKDSRPLRDFYLSIIKQELEAYNATHDPMVDENGNKVVFP